MYLGDACINICLGSTSDFVDWFSWSIDHMESWHSLNSINCGWILVDINVDFGQSNSLLTACTEDIGADSYTRGAPACVEINKNYFVLCCEGQQLGLGFCIDLSHFKISFINYNLRLIVYQEYITFIFWSIRVNL